MDVVFSQTDSGRHIFSLRENGKDIFTSFDEDLPFLGEYGEYATREDSMNAFSKLAFLNPEFIKIAEIEKEQKDSIKSRVVDQFNRKAVMFIKFIDQIEHFNDRSKLQERVTMLKDQFDQFTKSVTDTVHEFEGDTEPESEIEEQDIQQIGFEEVKDPYARDLVKLKKRIRKFYKKLKKKFGDYLEADSISFLKKLASVEEEFKRDILLDFGDSIIRSIQFKNPRVISLETDDTESRILISTDSGDLVVKFSNQLVMTEILPLGGFSSSHPYMTHRFYNEIWMPIFLSVGNYMLDEDHIVVPDQPTDVKIGYSEGKYLRNVFVGFDIRDNSKVKVNVYIIGNHSPIQKTCMFSVASKDKENFINKELESSKRDLLSSQMVLCVNSGTKYDGIAGKIQRDQTVDRSGYFEVPVTFTFDTGAEETVVLPSYNLKRYM